MIDSTHLKEIKRIANEYDNKLLTTDPRFQRSVMIIHQDGSVFFFQRAFMLKKDDWLIIFSGHHGVHIYDKTDVVDYDLYLATSDNSLEELP